MVASPTLVERHAPADQPPPPRRWNTATSSLGTAWWLLALLFFLSFATVIAVSAIIAVWVIPSLAFPMITVLVRSYWQLLYGSLFETLAVFVESAPSWSKLKALVFLIVGFVLDTLAT